ncbi:WD40 repeat domain-containing protein [Spirosoma aerophilum]
MKKALLIVVVLFTFYTPLLAQYARKNVKFLPPKFTFNRQAQEGGMSLIEFAYFLTDTTLIVVTSKSTISHLLYHIVHFDGKNFTVKKDITNEFYPNAVPSSGNNFTLQTVAGKDFFYARRLPYGDVKQIDKNGEVKRNFMTSLDFDLSIKSKEQREKVAEFMKEKDPRYRLLGINSGLIQTIEPNSSEDDLFGLGYFLYDGWVNYKPKKYTSYNINELNKVKIKDDKVDFFKLDKINFLKNGFSNRYIDFKRNRIFYISKIGNIASAVSDFYRYYFTIDDYSQNSSEEFFFGRGINEKITSLTIEKENNVAFVGWADGVIDTYDLTINDRSQKTLNRLNRIYANPTKKITHIAYSKDKNYLISAATDDVDKPTWAYIRVWNSKNDDQVYSLHGAKDINPVFGEASIKQLEVSPGGRYVLAVAATGELKIWEIN